MRHNTFVVVDGITTLEEIANKDFLAKPTDTREIHAKSKRFASSGLELVRNTVGLRRVRRNYLPVGQELKQKTEGLTTPAPQTQRCTNCQQHHTTPNRMGSKDVN